MQSEHRCDDISSFLNADLRTLQNSEDASAELELLTKALHTSAFVSGHRFSRDASRNGGNPF